jgi:cation diffusion facilitator CzcD-associated flavoprotein CzcO
VAAVGTGASAIQFVPAIQPKVAQMHVFQRTPPWVVPHTNRPITELEETWHDSPRAHLGTAVAGFPNLFVLLGPNTGLGHNSMVYMAESQIAHVLDALKEMRDRGADVVREAA